MLNTGSGKWPCVKTCIPGDVPRHMFRGMYKDKFRGMYKDKFRGMCLDMSLLKANWDRLYTHSCVSGGSRR